MVGNHSQRLMLKISTERRLSGGLNQMLKEVNFIVAVHPLHNGGNALQAHAGINRGPWQRCHLTTTVALVLHKHQVPDFDIAIEVVIITARRATRHVGTVVVKDFRTWATGAGITHLPKVVFIESRKALGTNAHFFEPDFLGFVIRNMHGDPQAFFR